MRPFCFIFRAGRDGRPPHRSPASPRSGSVNGPAARPAMRAQASMSSQNAHLESALDTLGRAQFALVDVLRRSGGAAVAAFGLGPPATPPHAFAPPPPP